MKVELTQEQIMKTIEGICYVSDTDTISMRTDATETEKNLCKIIDDIYTIVHSHKKGSCHNVHGDWRQKAVEIYNGLVEGKVINA